MPAATVPVTDPFMHAILSGTKFAKHSLTHMTHVRNHLVIGIMGLGMAKNLLNKRKHHLLVWNRDVSKSEALASEFPGQVSIAATAREVVQSCAVSRSSSSNMIMPAR